MLNDGGMMIMMEAENSIIYDSLSERILLNLIHGIWIFSEFYVPISEFLIFDFFNNVRIF